MSTSVSPIMEMEMERLDQEIEKVGKQFYTALLGKKRRVKRKWLEISAMTNAHLLQTLPYRAMLGHVANLAKERDVIIQEILDSQDSTTEKRNESVGDLENETKEENENDNNDACQCGAGTFSRKSSTSTEGEPGSKEARDEAIQTEESSFDSKS